MMTEDYILEKLEAFNVAIDALRIHEGADEGAGCEVTPGLARSLREKLAKKLERERDGWFRYAYSSRALEKPAAPEAC
jgi:hypothetical protein